MSAYRLRIEIPELPVVMTNARTHWRVKHKDTQHWDQVIGWAVAGKKPPRPLPRAKLTLIRYSSSCPDWDNLAASFKNPVDALVTAGVLKDDNRACIGMPEFYWQKTAPKQGRIEIVVEEIKEGEEGKL